MGYFIYTHHFFVVLFILATHMNVITYPDPWTITPSPDHSVYVGDLPIEAVPRCARLSLSASAASAETNSYMIKSFKHAGSLARSISKLVICDFYRTSPP